jgi:vacuolar-type H+-ATPase subunit H
MSIGETLKALAEFESQLASAKTNALEAKRQMVKAAGEWAELAKAEAVAEAERIASQTVLGAREEAEAKARLISDEGESAQKGFRESLSKRMPEAVELVARMLLGESS